MTIEQAIRERLPDMSHMLDVEGTWNYEIYSPMSFIDDATIIIHVWPGRIREGKRIVIVWDLVSNELRAVSE